MYLLQNGVVLYETNTYRAINPEDLLSIAPTDGPIGDNYYYMYDYNSGLWYEYLLPQENFDCISCDIDLFFRTILENGGIFLGRYMTPLEDVIILMTGQDLEGVSQSQAVAGTFLVVEFIPGSGLLKGIRLIKFGDEIVDATQA